MKKSTPQSKPLNATPDKVDLEVPKEELDALLRAMMEIRNKDV